MQHPNLTTHFWLMLALSAGMALPPTQASASDGMRSVDTNAVLGGAIGGGAGAAVGSAMGGRNGAMIGSAVGAVAGVAIATPQSNRGGYVNYDDYDEHDRGRHRGHHKHRHEHED